MNKFTKADLKPGMIVETRNGNRYIIYEFVDELIRARDEGWLNLSEDKIILAFKKIA